MIDILDNAARRPRRQKDKMEFKFPHIGNSSVSI